MELKGGFYGKKMQQLPVLAAGCSGWNLSGKMSGT
jgi:hypothetical protein